MKWAKRLQHQRKMTSPRMWGTKPLQWQKEGCEAQKGRGAQPSLPLPAQGKSAPPKCIFILGGTEGKRGDFRAAFSWF